jgi:hypothetical protein
LDKLEHSRDALDIDGKSMIGAYGGRYPVAMGVSHPA